MDLLDGDVWHAIVSQLDREDICNLAQASRLGWRASCYASALDVELDDRTLLEEQLANVLAYVTRRVRRDMQINRLEVHIDTDGLGRTKRTVTAPLASLVRACSKHLENVKLRVGSDIDNGSGTDQLMVALAECGSLKALALKLRSLEVLHLYGISLYQDVTVPARAPLRDLLAAVAQLTRLRVLCMSAIADAEVDGGEARLRTTLQALPCLTHLALITHVSEASSMELGDLILISERLGGVLEHGQLEVLIATSAWLGRDAVRLSCASLRTLALVLGQTDMHGSTRGGYVRNAERVARTLAAAAHDAPRLRAVQLVLDAVDWQRASAGRALWAALAKLPRLASLTLGWAFYDGEPEEHMGEDMASCLDDVDADLPGVTQLGLHASNSPLDLEGAWQHQAGMAAVIHAAGRLRERGVLRGLAAVHVAGSTSPNRPVPRPDAAPDVEVVLLGAGRRVPVADDGDEGVTILATDDVLQDVQAALAVRRGWDWDKSAECADMSSDDEKYYHEYNDYDYH